MTSVCGELARLFAAPRQATDRKALLESAPDDDLKVSR
jgi:hypothetical protein